MGLTNTPLFWQVGLGVVGGTIVLVFLSFYSGNKMATKGGGKHKRQIKKRRR